MLKRAQCVHTTQYTTHYSTNSIQTEPQSNSSGQRGRSHTTYFLDDRITISATPQISRASRCSRNTSARTPEWARTILHICGVTVPHICLP